MVQSSSGLSLGVTLKDLAGREQLVTQHPHVAVEGGGKTLQPRHSRTHTEHRPNQLRLLLDHTLATPTLLKPGREGREGVRE